MKTKHKLTSLSQRPRPKIFIGSSTEGLAIARALQSALYYEAEPIVWSQGVFGLSGGTLESLVNECDSFDFAVFVLTADDLVRRRKQRGNAPRDNILFELGLFMGRLGRDRTFFVHCKTDELLLPTDLAGVTAATYLPPSKPSYIHAALSAATSPILSAIQTLGPRDTGSSHTDSISNELDALRIQVAEMRIALSSFARYAQALPSRESRGETASTIGSDGKSSEVLLGTWRGDSSGTTAWCIKIGDQLRCLYSYADDGDETGELYNWKRTGNTIFSQFRWLNAKGIRGYAWFEIVGEDLLRGGWWYVSDVPKHLVSKLPHVPNMVPWGLRKISRSVAAGAKRQILKYYKRGPDSET
ncbi:MAG: nucleotide-binding protein [Pirellulales bacterium]|nr:nucleotide-binding protein [Pirellulales bacterium]